MVFELTVLGTSSALPAFNRFPSAQLLRLESRSYLIDCGEGTQLRLFQYARRIGKINQIFISHLHGDHYYGLMGVLSSLSLLGRKTALTVLGPEGLKEIFDTNLRYSGGHPLSYPVHFQVIDPTRYQKVFEDTQVEVFSLPLDHRIPAAGFLFREKQRPRNMISEKILEYQIPYQQIPAIKAGADFIMEDGRPVPNEELTLPPPEPRSFAYCSDTSFKADLIPLLSGVDLLYHESTFCEDNRDRAHATGHSTAKEAATIAARAGAQQLILGHYSSRYEDLTCFLEEARAVFPNTELGEDGRTYGVDAH